MMVDKAIMAAVNATAMMVDVTIVAAEDATATMVDVSIVAAADATGDDGRRVYRGRSRCRGDEDNISDDDGGEGELITDGDDSGEDLPGEVSYASGSKTKINASVTAPCSVRLCR